MEMFSLAGRTALVTGGAGGIGFALAEGLARAGASVVLNGRNTDALEDAAARLEKQGARVSVAAFDVTDAVEVRDAVATLMDGGTTIDILVNNAGIQRRAALHEFDDADWHALMRTNLDSVYLVSKALAPAMIERGRGKIINIASVQAELARPTIAPYAASKGAVRNLTRGMCADWARFGIQVNAIAPGYFDTPLNKALVDDPAFDSWLRARTPAGRWGRLEDLQGIAVLLASPASDYINGQTIFVDGGMTVVV
ncbi:glucose 1-dehydrogenase [Sphingopyxis sp. FD7]|uniref:glucose 1-dehydrogenase n=1 Tax=Sphingopyxis sp. FD7 TaxID=1914525 RepID=UPI000DC63863|nr:glucose 1-dehydrogenase [Sphingopyxis sp. FD7]BBB14536.1 gluconate 5-dehydrogenase protein [Sphingopyxis sp. FD7]